MLATAGADFPLIPLPAARTTFCTSQLFIIRPLPIRRPTGLPAPNGPIYLVTQLY
jgi:hypothetical protein